MANYTNQANVEGYLKRSLTSQESAIIQMLLDGADVAIQNETDRQFAIGSDSDADQVWYYDAPNKYFRTIGDMGQTPDPILFLDDIPIRSVTKIEYLGADGTLNLIDDEHYVTYPLNGPGVDYIEFRSGYWTPGLRNLKITGKANEYDAVPKAIVMAATALVADWVMANTQNLKMEDIEGYRRQWQDNNSEGMPALVLRLLAPYRRVLL